jgi:hypothetical protein
MPKKVGLWSTCVDLRVLRRWKRSIHPIHLNPFVLYNYYMANSNDNVSLKTWDFLNMWIYKLLMITWNSKVVWDLYFHHFLSNMGLNKTPKVYNNLDNNLDGWFLTPFKIQGGLQETMIQVGLKAKEQHKSQLVKLFLVVDPYLGQD